MAEERRGHGSSVRSLAVFTVFVIGSEGRSDSTKGHQETVGFGETYSFTVFVRAPVYLRKTKRVFSYSSIRTYVTVALRSSTRYSHAIIIFGPVVGITADSETGRHVDYAPACSGIRCNLEGVVRSTAEIREPPFTYVVRFHAFVLVVIIRSIRVCSVGPRNVPPSRFDYCRS